MNIGILVINDGDSISDCANFIDVKSISSSLSENGFFVTAATFLCSADNILDEFKHIKTNLNALIVLGKIDVFFDKLKVQYVLNSALSVMDIDGVSCAVSAEYSDNFVANALMPMLNGKSSTTYSSYIFKTFSKTEDELRELLKDYIKNHNKINFKFVSSPMKCDVLVRYSNKTDKNVVNDIIAKVTAALADCAYSYSSQSLESVVAELLMLRGKKIKIAESFTGGGVASALINYPGMSACLREGIVCYSNESKISRLKVDPKIIANYGAVSIETAYEMSANLLMDGDCDIAIATTGNAGPTSEKPDQEGLCFIAVGDVKGVNLYNYYFVGDRQYVINCGVQAALFRLYQLLTQDEFKAMLASKGEKI